MPFEPPAFEEVETENEVRHNGAPDRLVLCSGGMDSVAMTHYMMEEQWGGDGWSAWEKRPVVVFLETTIGLSSQRLYVQRLGREYNWQVVCWQTHQDYEAHTEDEGFYGNQQHDKIFNVLKQRQIAKAATIAGNPHVYFGSRMEEKGEDKVDRVDHREDIGAWTHNPIYDWSDQDVVDYLRDREVPFNPNWEASHFTDCGCGATASREELIELEAEGYEVFAEKLRDLEERVETDDRRETWAWSSFDDAEQVAMDAQNDPEQTSLGDLVCGPNCSGKSKALDAEYPTRPDGGEPSGE
jgi:3'-phosphoadenosine 5'-phosphosulfate sulfotransferase (PAPS reductase)/FAD synthetase